MFIRFLTSISDAHGRSYRPGAEVEWPDDEADRFIAAGHAVRIRPDPEKCVDLLEGMGAGLYAVADTDPELIAMAKARNIPFKATKAAPAGAPEESPGDGDNGS